MDENLINQTTEDIEYDAKEVHEVVVEQEPEVVVDISESMGWVSGDNRYHDSLLGTDYLNQHPISAITGLRDELDEIESLKSVESNKFNSANYYKWSYGARDTYGYFVSITPGDSTIDICGGADIFGVTVSDAGFIGGQNDVKRDNTYSLVVTSGLVDVRCELDVDVGDYVVSNSRGCAKKTELGYGYKVISTEIKHGDRYAVIMLGVQADVTSSIGEALNDIDNRVSVNETNITAAINVANQAYNKAGESASISDDLIERVKDAVVNSQNAVDDVKSMNDALTSTSAVATQAKAIAESAVTSAESMRKEAIDLANDALSKSAELRKDFDDTSKEMKGDIDNAVKDLEEISKDLEPLATWPDAENPSGIAGFVARADKDSATLASVTKFEGEFGDAISGFVQEATKENATVKAIASYQQKDEDGNVISSGASGLISQVDANKAAIDILVNIEGEGYSGLAGMIAQVYANKSSVETLASHVVGEFENTDDWVEDDKDTNKVYYAKNNGRYYYYDNTTNEWKSTEKSYEAGLSGSLAGVQSIADGNSASINSLTTWRGTTDIAMARVEQKADANGAYIHSTVSNMDKYSVGPHSQAYGFTLEQAQSVLEKGMIYVPTEIITEEYEYKDGEETKKYSRNFTPGFLYQWGELSDGSYRWITVDKDYSETSEINTSSQAVYFTASEPSVSGNFGYWYTNGDTITGTTGVYEPYTLYKWESYVDENDSTQYHWVAVATLAGNASNRAVSQIRQDTNSISIDVTNAKGDLAGIKAWAGDDFAAIQDTVSWHSENGDSLVSFMQEAGEDFAKAAQIASIIDKDGNVTAASIVTAVNGAGSSVTIDAGHINLNGVVTANNNVMIGTDGKITAVNANITGKITATSGYIGDDVTGFEINDNAIRNVIKYHSGQSNVVNPVSAYMKGYNELEYGSTYLYECVDQDFIYIGTDGIGLMHTASYDENMAELKRAACKQTWIAGGKLFSNDAEITGKIVATDGEFTGKVTAISGYIGDASSGFAIASNAIRNVLNYNNSQYYMTNPTRLNSTDSYAGGITDGNYRDYVYVGADGVGTLRAKYASSVSEISAQTYMQNGELHTNAGVIGDGDYTWNIGSGTSNAYLYCGTNSIAKDGGLVATQTNNAYFGTNGLSFSLGVNSSADYTTVVKSGHILTYGDDSGGATNHRATHLHHNGIDFFYAGANKISEVNSLSSAKVASITISQNGSLDIAIGAEHGLTGWTPVRTDNGTKYFYFASGILVKVSTATPSEDDAWITVS